MQLTMYIKFSAFKEFLVQVNPAHILDLSLVNLVRRLTRHSTRCWVNSFGVCALHLGLHSCKQSILQDGAANWNRVLSQDTELQKQTNMYFKNKKNDLSKFGGIK